MKTERNKFEFIQPKPANGTVQIVFTLTDYSDNLIMPVIKGVNLLSVLQGERGIQEDGRIKTSITIDEEDGAIIKEAIFKSIIQTNAN